MILQINNIHKHFGGIYALNNCCLDVEKGQITAIIGPNGSGKSTLFNVISRLEKNERGSVGLNNENITLLKDYEVSRKGISRTFQDVRLFRNLTIQDHIEIAMSNTDEGIWSSVKGKRTEKTDKVKEILKIVHLDKPLDTIAVELSYGQRKLLDLAMALAKPHEVLMLDEPVAGVNPNLRKEIKEILKNLKKEGETILIIEHDMNFIMDLADHIYVLDAGTVIAEGKPKQIQNNKKVLDAYLGE